MDDPGAVHGAQRPGKINGKIEQQGYGQTPPIRRRPSVVLQDQRLARLSAGQPRNARDPGEPPQDLLFVPDAPDRAGSGGAFPDQGAVAVGRTPAKDLCPFAAIEHHLAHKPIFLMSGAWVVSLPQTARCAGAVLR
ncbi:hypothetical protein Aph02nite_18470 [Actinoplanes philippinensis]|nr:hypothetical protein Aph02nite_18470 [Actinoplanes philippinensis]